MIYREHAVCGKLSAFIRKIWVLDNSINPLFVTNKYILPNGCSDIIFVSGKGARVSNVSNELKFKEGVYFSGQMTELLEVEICPFSKVILVQFLPWTTALFSSFPFNSATNLFPPIREVNPCFYRKVRDLPYEDERQIIDFINKQFLDFLKKSRVSDLIQNSCSLLLNQPRNLTIKELSSQLGYSPRYVEKKFKNHLGLSPKEFSTIIKIRQTVDKLTYNKDDASLTQLALEFGFYDQSHFIK
ncbi:AraC family transcriptional regulator, partial [Xanthovirga aplysinae]|uniref:AraC family transcriptional regulator n=1 Tax=Xanthovirga aplysinae TaxID=2529853 RepID=UPI0012BD1275